MDWRTSATTGSTSEITAILISPDRDLVQQLQQTLPETRAFQIVADLKSYPPQSTLEIRVRQLRPELVLIDLATDLDAACELIGALVNLEPPVQVVGLHRRNDSEAILRSLRQGASEFLYAPFDPATQREAIARLRRLRKPESASVPENGSVIVFSSSKPGSGASTLATQTAFALQRQTGKRVLLADFDLMGGTIGFYLKLSHSYSLLDAVQHAEHLDVALWSSLTVNCGGVDILPAPLAPYADAIEAIRLHVVIDHIRQLYDWVILDLPAVFNRSSLVAISEADRAFLVSTSELPSLHLTRKALTLVDQLGFPKDRFQVLVNRVNKRDGIGTADMEKLFGCPVHASFPNDYFSLHRVVTLGQPLGGEGELGKAIESLASRLAASIAMSKKQAGKPALNVA
ncbi:MAG: AAA family ATPase [Bryobacteraceae bacterium]